MSLNRRNMTRQIARQTSLTEAQADEALMALIQIWTEALTSGGKIAIDNFLTLEFRRIERHALNTGRLLQGVTVVPAPNTCQYRLTAKPSRALLHKICF